MAKRAIVIIGGLVLSGIIAGCQFEENTIVYKGKEMPISEAEERIADELEVENPDLDLELSIIMETDD